MMTSRRAFATKLSKEPNEAIRQKIIKSLPKFLSNSRPNSSLGCFCEVPLNEVIEPIDWEEFIVCNQSLITSDPLKPFLSFPSDDIEVNVCQRVIPTIKPIIPDFDDVSAQENPHINQCLQCYTSNWIVVHKKYEHFVQFSDRSIERLSQTKAIARNEYEVDIEVNNVSENGFGDASQDRTPIQCSQSTSCHSSRPQSKIHDLPPYLRPPLASDEDTSEGSATPPSNRQSLLSECTPTSSTLTSRDTTPRGSVYDCANSRSSRSSWHFIDSPRNSKNLERTQSLHSNCGPRGSRTSSIFHLRNSQSDPLIPNLLDDIGSEEIDRINDLRRQEGRHHSLFTLYPLQEDEDLIEIRQPIPAPSEPNRHRIVVKCLSMKLELEIEPIFASLALYDAKERKKLSENFYFDINNEGLKRLLSSHIQYQDVSTLSRSCIFNITNPSSDMFLVIKLEKVLQGDVNECAEPYMKDEKNREKLKTNAALCCERLGKYRMPFAWTAVYLLDVFSGIGTNEMSNGQNGSTNGSDCGENKGSCNSLDSIKKRCSDSGSLSRKGSLERQKSDKRRSFSGEELGDAINNFHAVTLTINSFFKQDNDKLTDEDLYKYLLDLKRPTSTLKRLKCIPGILKIDISPLPELFPKYCLTPELVRIHPYPDDKGRPIKEILEFSSKEIYSPHYVYRNILYIYPKNVNFTNRQGSARNITVKIQVMNNEDDYSSLPIIFGKSSCPEYSSECFTSVSYHNKNPNFNDEIKVKLPPKLTEQTHILFTFYHIHTKPKQLEQTTDEVLGYTWIPLLRDGRLQTGPYCLPVMMDKPPASYSFLTPSIQIPNTRWVDNHKGIFTVSLEAVSSVYSQDMHLDNFLHLSTSIDEHNIPQRLLSNIENEFKTTILSISSSQIEPLVQFMPIVLNRLIRLLVRPPVINGNQILNISQSVFESIASIVAKINKTLYSEYSDIRSGILSTFIHYQVIFPAPQALPHSFIDQSNMDSNGDQTFFNTNSSYHARSNSNPDVPIGASNDIPFQMSKGLDRTSSVRSPQSNSQYLSENSISYNKKGMVTNLQKLFHEELVLQWLVSSGTCRDIALSNAGFFFDIIVKSIGEHLAVCGALHTPRRERFPKQFTDDIISLINLITSDIINRLNRELKDLKLIQSLNNSVAFFIRDLLSLLDRYYVFNLIRIYFKQMSNSIQFTSETSNNYSFLLRLDFMRVISGHEHFICLNLPFGTPTTTPTSIQLPKSWDQQSSVFSPLDRTLTTLLDRITTFSELTDDYRRQHFLTGVIFCCLSLALEVNSASVHSKAVNLIRALMTSHDWDCRYSEPEVKSRIASLYLPLIAIVLDALPQLYDWKSDDVFKSDSRSASTCNTLKRNSDEKRRPIVLNSNSDLDDLTASPLNSPLNQSVAMAIAGSGVFNRQEEESYEPRRWPLREDTTKHLLICFLWVIKNANQTVLYRYMNEMPFHRIYQLLEVLKICVSCFEYKGLKAIKKANLMSFKKPFDIKTKLEDAILGLGGARRELILRRRDRNPPQSSQSFSQSDSVRWRKDSTLTRYNSSANHTERTKMDYETEASLSGTLCSELNLVVLDAIEKVTTILVQHSDCDNEQNSVQSKELLGNVMQIVMYSLSLNQSTFVLQNIFPTQRSLTMKFPQIIFEDGFEVEFCADLCLQLLRHCSSSIGLVRAQAAASLYTLMRQNYSSKAQNFAKIKMQVTMSLSHLVGTSKSFNEPSLRRSLKTMLVYAVIDADMQESNFPEQVQELVFNLHMILSDTIKMKEYKEDPEMLLDLMYRIAKGYQNSPDLRLTWLQNMAQKHTDRGNHAEAAQCFVHSCALVCEYLHLFENKPYIPVSCVAFQKISSNILEESLVSNEVPVDNKEGLFTGKSFSESGLVALIEQAAICFNGGGMYEAVNEVFKLLIPIAEAHHDYKKLASIHGKLQEAFIKIEQQTGKRVFGTYFRVGFYGPKFGDLDREEFVYKEPFLTKLPEISSRLESFYSDQFGEEFVEMIKDSNPVDINKLNSEKAYIQITYVEPYFDSWELDSRQTIFERNYNIKRFIYSTPFTMDGRAHGDLHEQYKRKTILTTINSFPYVKTRVLVQDRQQVVLTPIEVAIEDIQKKTIELAAATYQEPIDSKILQMVLQGCVGTTVNQGPFEVASVFLSESSARPPQQRPPSPLQNKLKSCFKDFCRKCGDALRKNRVLIGTDQKEYQKELERNYYKFTEKLAPLISTNGQQALRALRETYWNSSANIALRTKTNTLL